MTHWSGLFGFGNTQHFSGIKRLLQDPLIADTDRDHVNVVHLPFKVWIHDYIQQACKRTQRSILTSGNITTEKWLGLHYVPKYQRKRKHRIGSVLTCGFRMLFFHVKLGEFSVASSCDLPNFGVKDLDVRLLVPSKKNSTGANPFWKEKQRCKNPK